jgi:hypothetical protein
MVLLLFLDVQEGVAISSYQNISHCEIACHDSETNALLVDAIKRVCEAAALRFE